MSRPSSSPCPPPDVSLYVGCEPTSEQALARFDATFDGFEPDQALLGGTPARDLSESMTALVLSLRRVDIDRVNRCQGWWHRFTGADLEARLELEVAAHCLGGDMREASVRAATARRARDAMRADLPRLDAAQLAHGSLADATAAFLGRAPAADPVVARLQRRLGNLEALGASNRLVRAQMQLAIDHLDGLLDRFADIEQLLFPLWQRHALAVSQSAGPAEGAAATAGQFASIHRRLTGALAPGIATS